MESCGIIFLRKFLGVLLQSSAHRFGASKLDDVQWWGLMGEHPTIISTGTRCLPAMLWPTVWPDEDCFFIMQEPSLESK